MSMVLAVVALAVAAFTLGMKCGLEMAGRRLREKEAENAALWRSINHVRAGGSL